MNVVIRNFSKCSYFSSSFSNFVIAITMSISTTMEGALLSKHMSIPLFINWIPLATAFSVPYNTSAIEVCSSSISLILFMTGIVLFHKVLKIYFWRSTISLTLLLIICDERFDVSCERIPGQGFPRHSP
jgi:hypothetical protein